MIKPALQERFRNLKGILWDLDNTLYKSEDDLHRAFDRAIAQAAIENGASISLDEAIRLSGKSFVDHGYGGRVFVDTMGVDPRALHFSIHGLVDEKIIIRSEGLIDQMQSLSLHHVVVTHGARDWALRVLQQIGLIPLFPDHLVHALEDFDFHKKGSSRVPFETGLAALGLAPADVIMVEDQERNLRIPHEMGMGTVLLNHGVRGPDAAGYVDLVCRDAPELLAYIKAARV